MDKQKIENKAIYFMCLLSMICILVLIAYFFFLRNVEIDIMANAQYTYVGENGNASVTVSAKQGDLNQRTQDFLNSVQYEVSPNTDLSKVKDSLQDINSKLQPLKREYKAINSKIDKIKEVKEYAEMVSRQNQRENRKINRFSNIER